MNLSTAVALTPHAMPAESIANSMSTTIGGTGNNAQVAFFGLRPRIPLDKPSTHMIRAYDIGINLEAGMGHRIPQLARSTIEA